MKFLRAVFPPLALAFALFGAAPLPAQDTRLSNVSVRTAAGGADILITGFTIGPGPNKTILVRAVGPTLGIFGVPGTLADPKLELYNSSAVKIGENDNFNAVDAATFTAVGAFPLGVGAKDAAIVTTLAPGSYTAQVTGVGGVSGVALVEVYEVTGGATRLINLSTRAQVGTGSNILIPGITVAAGAGTRRLLLRAVGPTLGIFGVPGTLTDPKLELYSGPNKMAENDNWGTPVGAATADGTTLAAAFTASGAFALTAGSKDAALLINLTAGSYTLQVSGVGGTTGVALVEVYDLTPVTASVVTLAATKPTSDESGANPGEFTFTRTGDLTFPLTVSYGVGGSAVNGSDYPALLGTITIPAGAASVKLPLSPNPDVQTDGLDTVVLTLTAGGGYTIGAPTSATVTIADSPATLYVAMLRPAGGATSSTAYGTATILLSSSGTVASVNVSFSNLSSAQTSAHLTLGANDDFVADLPRGQINGVQWLFAPTGVYTSTALLNALRNGTLSVRLDSATFPNGEARGVFVPGTGSQIFTVPAAAPAVSLTNITAADASRLLTQATFGPKKSEIDALTGGSITTWIDAQMALPYTPHRAATLADQVAFGGSPSVSNWQAVNQQNRQPAWFKNVLTGPDQLRQRVAFALSQIFVVSDVSLDGDHFTEWLAAYYDRLGNGAFGNFRALLEEVTLNPMMGLYLSTLRNAKADPATGTTPDENYAREVMQLFTIGLSLLQPDGTLQLGADGLPIPTYNQTTISEMAKVFTGWSYPSANLAQFRTAGDNYFSPMQVFPAFHEDGAKNISPILPAPIPANLGGAEDLKRALDALFNHQNTPAFISRQLIQRLVTSNPSPAYVYRVAEKFRNNGSGTRGDLGAVVRAILTDYEARSPALVGNVSYGKLKEPLLRLTGLLRTFNATSRIGRYAGMRYAVNGVAMTNATPNPGNMAAVEFRTNGSNHIFPQVLLAQASLRSPTVFNFFSPGYVAPGPLAAAGLVAPEFQITDDTYSITVPNYLRDALINRNDSTRIEGDAALVLDLTFEQTLAANPVALLDHLALVLAGGNLPAATRTRITGALAALPASATPLERAQTAVLGIVTTPAGAIQK